MGQIRISSNGTVNIDVASSEDIADALEQFTALVQEAVLIDGREFDLTLQFYAREMLPEDDEIKELF
jgi:CTP-dependent riboflavin kinase